MTKKQIIESIEDKLFAVPRPDDLKRFHRGTIIVDADMHYHNLLLEAYSRDFGSVEGCLHTEGGVDVERDEFTGTLYCVVPKPTADIFSVRGGVYAVRKEGDSSVRFEALSTHLERKHSDLNISFSRPMKYWYEYGVEDADVSSSTSVPFTGFSGIVWFDGEDINKGDKLELDLVLSFDGHDSNQVVPVPEMAGGVQELIRRTWISQAQKAGLQIPENMKDQDNE